MNRILYFVSVLFIILVILLSCSIIIDKLAVTPESPKTNYVVVDLTKVKWDYYEWSVTTPNGKKYQIANPTIEDSGYSRPSLLIVYQNKDNKEEIIKEVLYLPLGRIYAK